MSAWRSKHPLSTDLKRHKTIQLSRTEQSVVKKNISVSEQLNNRCETHHPAFGLMHEGCIGKLDPYNGVTLAECCLQMRE
jgi:hypothetical protein